MPAVRGIGFCWSVPLGPTARVRGDLMCLSAFLHKQRRNQWFENAPKLSTMRKPVFGG
jgi:hypothetical protein